MAKSTQLNFTQGIKLAATTIVNADTTTLKTIYTAGVNDSVVKGISVVNDDAIRVINLYVNNGSVDICIGAASLPANAGANGTTGAVDAMSAALFPGLPMDANGKRVIPLPAGYVLKASCQTTVTAGRTITVTAMVEDY